LKIPWYWLLGLAMMIVSATVFTAFQTSLWFLIFGNFPAPMFWLILLVYVSVTRALWEATLTVYLLTASIAQFTIFPFEGMLIFCLLMMIALVLIRERVFWGGATYFMLMVGVASLAAPIFYWLCSRWIDKNPIFIPDIFDWLITGGLTVVFSPPLYRLYQWIDRFSEQDAGAESRLGPR
jgi:hypothetical protein